MILYDSKLNITGGYVSTGIYSASVAITAASTPVGTLYDIWHSGSTEYATASFKPKTLSGGDNIGDNVERGKTEIEMIKFAMKNKIPLFGVCRGMQLINTFFNGTISENSNSGHVGKPHNIDIMNPSLVSLFGHDKLEVNSFHNNLIKKDDIGDELDVFALSEKDFTIEGCFHKKYPMIGVMWHPERNPDENSIQLFQRIFSLEN